MSRTGVPTILGRVAGKSYIINETPPSANNILSDMLSNVNNIPVVPNIIQQRSVATGIPKINYLPTILGNKAITQVNTPILPGIPTILGNPKELKVKDSIDTFNTNIDVANPGIEPNNIWYRDIPEENPLYTYVNELRKITQKAISDPNFDEETRNEKYNARIYNKFYDKLEVISRNIMNAKRNIKDGKVFIFLGGSPKLDINGNVYYSDDVWEPFYNPMKAISIILRGLGSNEYTYGSTVWEQIAISRDLKDIRFRVIPRMVNRPQGGRYSRYVVKFEYKDEIDLIKCQIRPQLRAKGSESKGEKQKYFQETAGWGLHCLNYAMYQYFKEILPNIDNRYLIEEINKINYNDKLMQDVPTRLLTKLAKDFSNFRKRYFKKSKPLGINLMKLYEDGTMENTKYPNKASNKTHEMVNLGLFDEHYVYNYVTDYKIKGKCVRVITYIRDLIVEKKLVFNDGVYMEEAYRPTYKQPINIENDQIYKTIDKKGNKFEEKLFQINNGKFGIKKKNEETMLHNENIDNLLAEDYEKNQRRGGDYICANMEDIKAKRNRLHKQKLSERLELTGYDIYVADTENSVTGENHSFILSACAKLGPNSEVFFQNSIKGFFNKFPEDRLNIIYFHNLKYDWSILKRMNGISCLNKIEKAGQIYQTEFKYFKKYFIFKCSYKIVPRPLRDFNEAFKLDVSKQEYILYELYTSENIKPNFVTYRAYEKGDEYLCAFKDSKGYKKLLKQELEVSQDSYMIIDERIVVPKTIVDKLTDYFKDGKYFHMDHLKYYLYYDIVTMRDGILVYREQMKQVTVSPMYPEGQDIYNNCSLPSFAFDYLNGKGVLKTIYSVRRGLRRYIERCLYGGRVFTRLNRKWDIRGILKYFDFNSLYPSAAATLRHGAPAGEAEEFTKDFIEAVNKLTTKDKLIALNQVPNYQVEFKITRVGIERAVGIINHNNFKDGVTRYDGSRKGLTNLITNQCRYTLEDLIEFQDIDFELISGIYHRKQDFTICQVFKELYDQRLIYKSNQEDLLQEMIKLLMNSSLGKLAISETTIKSKCYSIVSEKQIAGFMNANYNNIEECIQYGNIMEIKYQASEDHCNMCHVMNVIYSYSKHLMNRAIFLLEDFGIEVYYSDTDSIVIQLENKETEFEAFKIEYKLRYGIDFEGKNLMQFKLDFPNVLAKDYYEVVPEGINPKAEVFEITHASRMIALGRKFYYMEVPRKNKFTGEEDIYYLKHAKGLSEDGVDAHERRHGKTITEIYEFLYLNNNIKDSLVFDLVETGVAFEYTNDGVKSRDKFTRTIFFPEGSPEYKEIERPKISLNILNGSSKYKDLIKVEK